MDDLTIARVIHVLGVVLWIGGVAFVTTTLLPALRQRLREDTTGENPVTFFEALEGRFAWQARLTTILTGASGFYLLYAMDGWERYGEPGQWWLWAMTVIWAIFTLMLFVLEPLVLHKWFERRARERPEGTIAMVLRLHWVLLIASLITVAGAVAGVHGG